MSDVPPQAPPAPVAPARGGAVPHFDPGADVEAELARVYGTGSPRAHAMNGIHGTLGVQGEAIGRHGRELQANREAWLIQQGRNEMTRRRLDATDAEVNRIRAFLQSYDGPLSWLVDGACVAIIVGASMLYLKWMDVDLTLGNLGLVIMADIVLICIALAFTSHIRRLSDPPAPPPQGGNGAGQPQQQNPPRQRRFGRRAQPAPAAPAAPAATTQQLPVVPLPPPPPPPAAPPQANP